MPIMNIKAKAKASTAKPKATKTSTPARKTAGTAKRGTAKPAAKTGSTRKTTPAKASTKTTAAKKTTTRAAKPQISEAQLNKHLKILEKGKDRLDKAQREHDASSRNAHEIAQEALAAGVPMKIVSETLNISRQYLYKGYKGTRATKEGQTVSRNGNGSGSKTAAKAAVKRTAPAKKSAASTKTTGSRPKIRVGGKK